MTREHLQMRAGIKRDICGLFARNFIRYQTPTRIAIVDFRTAVLNINPSTFIMSLSSSQTSSRYAGRWIANTYCGADIHYHET
jgi:hypothetical protein